jgi:hypothetical protein
MAALIAQIQGDIAQVRYDLTYKPQFREVLEAELARLEHLLASLTTCLF